jgi:drug/metabolite transporter (DMT)-like permease
MAKRDAQQGGQIGWLGALLVLAIVWGGSIPATKLALEDFPPLTLTGLRYLAAAPFFAALLVGRKLPPPRALAAMAGLGILGIGVGQLFQTLGVQRTSASAATMISAAIPMLIVLLAALRLGQAIRWRHWAGLAAAFLGVAIVATGDPRRALAIIGTSGFDGDALILGSAVAIAAYYVLSVPLVARHSALTVAAWSSIAGAVSMLPLVGWELRSATPRPTLLGVAIILYLAVLVTVAGVWLWLRALERLPAAMAASMQYLQPLVGVAISASLFGDRLTFWFWVGTGLVFLGIALSTVPSRRGAGAPDAPAPLDLRRGQPLEP